MEMQDTSRETRAITEAAMQGMTNAAALPNDLSPSAMVSSRPDQRREIAAEVAPVVEHLTNNEPWYQSRVTLGALGTIVTSGLAIWGLVANGLTDPQLLAPPIIAIFTALLGLYGRWVATKPLGA